MWNFELFLKFTWHVWIPWKLLKYGATNIYIWNFLDSLYEQFLTRWKLEIFLIWNIFINIKNQLNYLDILNIGLVCIFVKCEATNNLLKRVFIILKFYFMIKIINQIIDKLASKKVLIQFSG